MAESLEALFESKVDFRGQIDGCGVVLCGQVVKVKELPLFLAPLACERLELKKVSEGLQLSD